MAPLFVGSNSDDSRIRSDRVGLAASTSNPASADTGDAYYNSTDNKLNVYDGSDWAEAGGGGTFSGIASGALTNGATVIINTDGTVSVVSGGDTPSAGTAVVFESASIYYHHMAFDSTNDKVIIAYRDDGNSEYGTAIVGTVSGTSISFGSPTVFESGRSDTISVAYDSTNDKVVISYKDNPNDGYGTVIRGSVSGTSINFDTPIVFHSDSTEWTSIAYDSGNSKLVVAYRDNENDLGEAVVVDSTTLITTNLTSTNYIGIAAEAISNGATGKVTIAGGVNSGQTGLTTARTQYVQGDGSLGTSAGSPSVVAGTSISGTQIIVKG